ncbi:MAG: hypothetical protein ACI4RD_05850 [Kiritimatiellia bacterium]
MSKQMFGQIYYGRDRDGYGVMGVSPIGRPFVGAVAALCRAVGSPDRPGDIPPFLLNKREGASVIMMRACRGAADPTGRATILFHALVADRDSLRLAGLDAFALANAGVFAEVCPGRELPDLAFPNVRPQDAMPARTNAINVPATISSERPLDEFVRQELGANSLDWKWATFTFNPLSGFDVCVLSSHSPRKGEGTQYVFDDAGLHRLSSGTVRLKAPGKGTASAGGPFKKKSSPLLLFSLTANLVLVCALLFCGGGGNQKDSQAGTGESEGKKTPPPSPSVMTEAEAKGKWEKSWREGWIRELRQDFEKSMRASGGEWPVQFEHEYSGFPQSVRSAESRPDEDKMAKKWQIYRSCKTCSDFIQKHLYPSANP